uniref:Uncharacterized protein n=1 Tax=Opuntia streptacantha TaxID=393608 RepID=A0A7C8ZC39_OPUST
MTFPPFFFLELLCWLFFESAASILTWLFLPVEAEASLCALACFLVPLPLIKPSSVRGLTYACSFAAGTSAIFGDVNQPLLLKYSSMTVLPASSPMMLSRYSLAS